MLLFADPDSSMERGYRAACPFTIRMNTQTIGLLTPARGTGIKAFHLLCAAGTAELL